VWTISGDNVTDGNEPALAIEITSSDFTCLLTVSCSGLAREKVKGLNVLGCCQEKEEWLVMDGMVQWNRGGWAANNFCNIEICPFLDYSWVVDKHLCSQSHVRNQFVINW